MLRKSYTYQLKGARQIHKFGGIALLSWHMGLGKTHCSYLYADRHPELRPIVVVCPKSLKWQWQREAAVAMGEAAEIIEGIRPSLSQLNLHHKILIINYDILKPWVPYLKKLQPKLLIIDECHALINQTSQRTTAVRELAENIPHKLALSGTPITNRPADLWPVLNILRPDLYPAFFPFGHKYCEPKKQFGKWVFKGASNLEVLHRRLIKHVMLRLRKEDVFKDLPKKLRIALPLDLTDRGQYNLAFDELKGWTSSLGSTHWTKGERVEAFGRIEKLKQLVAKLKMPFVFEWIDNFLASTDEKLLVFGVHQETVKALHNRYKKESVLIYGEVSTKQRQFAVERFQKHADCRIFVGNIQAGGVGLNLTAASTVAFVELPWKPSDLTQAEDRCYARLGDIHGAKVYYILGRGTIEEWLCKIIRKKQRILDAVLDNGKVPDNFDVFNDMINFLRGDKHAEHIRRATQRRVRPH
jgi:SWI/SNF-related matrix-associated actin-dependent regulator 1 of chromatin subfamily A